MPRSINMLVADDSIFVQKVFLDIAQSSKIPVRLTSTDNGRDCLTLLRDGHIDLSFIDVHMPELSGMDAFWSARKQGIRTFVTLMSTRPSQETVKIARQLKAYEFLFKPFEHADVLAIMRTYARIVAPTKVLIVDDSASVRKIVQKVVQGSLFNCKISEAMDGNTAVAHCRESDVDVVFLDCNMPGINGLKTIKLLLSLQPAPKVVMISAEHDQNQERQARELGACAFLHKPFYSSDIDHVLHAALGLRSPKLNMEASEAEFDVSIEGRTIRLCHKISGHIFEYLWFQKPPYLRNSVIHPAAAASVAPARVAETAHNAALFQLNEARLLATA